MYIHTYINNVYMAGAGLVGTRESTRPIGMGLVQFVRLHPAGTDVVGFVAGLRLVYVLVVHNTYVHTYIH